MPADWAGSNNYSMSFWNNPENNSLKVILLVIVLGIAGYFVYTYMQNNSLSGRGAVINTGGFATESFTFSTVRDGASCTTTVCSSADASQCISLAGATTEDGMCSLNEQQANPEAQGLLEVLNGSAMAN